MEITVKKFNELSTKELYEILRIRNAVFIVEQNCPYQDIDELDKNAYHIYLAKEKKIVAYCRVLDKKNPLQEVSIGRVIATERRKGYATKLLEKAIEVALKNFHTHCILIEAQTYASKLYEKLGFQKISDPFFLDGIEHVKMCYKKED